MSPSACRPGRALSPVARRGPGPGKVAHLLWPSPGSDRGQWQLVRSMSLAGGPGLQPPAITLWQEPSSLAQRGSPGRYEAGPGSRVLWRGRCLCQGREASTWQSQLIPRHSPPGSSHHDLVVPSCSQHPSRHGIFQKVVHHPRLYPTQLPHLAVTSVTAQELTRRERRG